MDKLSKGNCKIPPQYRSKLDMGKKKKKKGSMVKKGFLAGFQETCQHEVLEMLTKLSTKKCGLKYKEFNKHRVPLEPEERKLVMARKATWHHGPNGGPSPAVWKSVLPSGKVWYITNTHRAMNVRPSLKGAISRYHRFIKGTA